ncbi:MAG: PQQ-binding-like beta-propeller repeat protein [Acidobacteriaceae bacterium]
MSYATSFLQKLNLQRAAGLLTLVLALGPVPLFGQNPAPDLPSSMQAESAVQAKKIYAVQCSLCHGADAHGGEYGPALAGNNDLRGKSVSWFHDVIKNGIPSGGMPAFNLPPADLDAVAELLQSFNVQAAESTASGDSTAGEQYFFGPGKCASCHMVDGRGAAVGPDLSRVARERTVPEIRASLLEPSAHVTPGYESVTVRLRNGQTLHGFARSQSNFEIALQDMDGRFHLLRKNQVLSVSKDPQSPMPPVHASPEELDNLMAYLSGLTGVQPGTASVPASSVPGGISFSDILHPKPGDWLTYNGNLSGNRYSPLAKINTGNVYHLQLKWIYTVPLWKQFYPDTSYFRENMQYFGLETTPLVADGILYATGPQQIYALDARTGQQIWLYSRTRTPGVVGDAGLASNRGLAILGDKVFMVTDDAHMIALNRITGKLVWEAVMPEKPMHYGGTVAPLVVKDMVIGGVAGGDWGVRGFLAAYRASDGKLVWRHWTVPAKGEQGAETWGGNPPETGGGATWTTGSYDPETDTIYWATGNPYPDGDGQHRPGDDLYTNSILALDPENGKLKWFYQVTPHDVEDWDTTAPLVLVDSVYRGEQRKILMHVDKNGFFYVLDRTNGHVLLAKPAVRVTWASGIGPNGRPQRIPDYGIVCPSAGSNWNAAAFSPVTRLYYVMVAEQCNVDLAAANAKHPEDEVARKYLEAINIDDGKIVWKVPELGPADGKRDAGILATAGGLLFYGDPSGDIVAADARTGEPLWHFPTNGENKASPMTYTVDGKQFVVLAVGPNLLGFSLP